MGPKDKVGLPRFLLETRQIKERLAIFIVMST